MLTSRRQNSSGRTLSCCFALAIVFAGSTVLADPPDILRSYRFITNKSTVQVIGGIAGIDWPLNIFGGFELVTGYKYNTGGPTAHAPTLEPFAEFNSVKGVLFDPRRASPTWSPGWDLDATLNLSGLSGTYTAPEELHFSGLDGQGQPIKLDATLAGSLLHLTGANSPDCCDFYSYHVDAYAHLLPWADFDGDGTVDADDAVIWRNSFGSALGNAVNGDANGDQLVDAADYVIWRQQAVGPSYLGISNTIPEPAIIPLSTEVALAILLARRQRFHFLVTT